MSIRRRTLSKRLFARCIGLLVLSASSASPCVDGATGLERTVWDHWSCWKEFVLWEFENYRMFHDEWSGYGFEQGCAIDMPFWKAMNSAFLINYGLVDDNHSSWHHSQTDYGFSTQGHPSVFHGSFYYKPSEGGDCPTAGSLSCAATHRFLAEDRTFLTCSLFNEGASKNDPALRAGAMVHESWHHWQAKNGYNTDHFGGPVDRCSASDCDYYYPHGVKDFVFGDMWRYTADGRYFHSPNQAQIEYLCDVGELSKDWVDSQVTDGAQIEAMVRQLEFIRNNPGYLCGDARMWSMPVPPPQPLTGLFGYPCTTIDDCVPGFMCGASGECSLPLKNPEEGHGGFICDDCF